MTYKEAKERVDKYNSETSSKVYYVAPNYLTDKKGCALFSKALSEEGYLKFLDPRPYSNNEDYFLFESNY
jgi:hypothetical protein